MAPEGVPRQLARQAMVLVVVVARVREDDLRVDPALQVLEDVLNLAADVRQEAVSELVHLDVHVRGAGQERGRARTRLFGAIARRSEHDPVDLELGIPSTSVRRVPPHPISMSSA